LPSNLRQTTRECVHFITRGHFWSHNKIGGFTNRANMNFLHQGFRKLSSDRQTYMTKIIYRITLWAIKNLLSCSMFII